MTRQDWIGVGLGVLAMLIVCSLVLWTVRETEPERKRAAEDVAAAVAFVSERVGREYDRPPCDRINVDAHVADPEATGHLPTPGGKHELTEPLFVKHRDVT